MIRPLLAVFFIMLTAGCTSQSPAVDKAAAQAGAQESLLNEILAARSDDLKARDQYRHPKETIEFFGIKPGMRVAQVSPGQGWYTHIVAPLIGPDSAVYGIYYNPTMWGQIEGRYTEAQIAERIDHIHDFVPMVRQISGAQGITAAAYFFGDIDPALHGTLDVVTLVRTLHNIATVESRGGYLTEALTDVHNLLKPGGTVGVIQHRAPEDADDEWANGRWGYLKQSAVIAAFENAGFELVAESEINANPKDKPGPGDYVWRLPPASMLQSDDPELKAAMLAIGESDRMTLKFIKK